MVIYTCNICNKTFSQQSNYNYHINRKNPCKNTINNKYICEYCNKNFTTNSNMHKHINKHCKIINKKKEDDILKLIFNKIEIMEKELKELKILNNISDNNLTNNINNSNNSNNNNSNNNITNNIKIVGYGREDMKKITDDIYQNILNKGFMAIIKLIEHTHFNKNIPEYNNIFLSQEDDYVFVYNEDEQEWKIMNKKDIINDLYENKKCILIDKFNLLKELNKLNEFTLKKFTRFIEEKDNINTITGIKDDIDVLLNNNKRNLEDLNIKS